MREKIVQFWEPKRKFEGMETNWTHYIVLGDNGDWSIMQLHIFVVRGMCLWLVIGQCAIRARLGGWIAYFREARSSLSTKVVKSTVLGLRTEVVKCTVLVLSTKALKCAFMGLSIKVVKCIVLEFWMRLGCRAFFEIWLSVRPKRLLWMVIWLDCDHILV